MGALKSGCERAREWVSLDLDGELSELEHALLRAHLDRCAACAAFAHDVRALTGELRAAPAETPAVPVTLPRRRSGAVRVLQVGAAAAAIAIAVGLGTLAGSLTSSRTAPAPSAGSVAATQQPYLEQRLLAMDRIHAEHGETGTTVAV
jgi:predicted anti-sigma-YlaC factor YlaD